MAEYIEREAAIQYFKERSKDFIGHEPIPPALVIMGCANEVDAIPAADVRPVVYAHWIKRPDFYLYKIEKYTATCSSCGLMAGYNEAKRFFHYCPNCGADMREVQDG